MTIDGPTILLQSGNYFNFMDPSGSSFTIEDVANGLAMTCRFGGQCRNFYSVAEHSIVASFHVTTEHAYAALMHDAAEAFIGDVPRPLKAILPDYRHFERGVERAVLARFGVQLPVHPEVKAIDLRMLATEQRLVMENYDEWGPIKDITPLPISLPLWSPIEAKAHFLQRFDELSRTGAQSAA